LLQKAKELDLNAIAGKELDWIERLDYTTTLSCPDDLKDNDIEREKVFMAMALEGALEAQKRVLAAGIPFERPEDYFAEMIKTDEQMDRIKKDLVEEASVIKKKEEARKIREMRKFGKQIQSQKIQERQKQKADTLSKIDAIKKRKRENNNLDDDDEFDLSLLDNEDDHKQNHKKKGKKSRDARDKQFGFGGKKRFQKSNNSDSVNEFSFNVKKNKKTFKKNRPGKSKRQNKK
jgi:rRNA-processing protein EBP2